jgi:hypothetical protein
MVTFDDDEGTQRSLVSILGIYAPKLFLPEACYAAFDEEPSNGALVNFYGSV